MKNSAEWLLGVLDANRRGGTTTFLAEVAKVSAKPLWIVVASVAAKGILVEQGVPAEWILIVSSRRDLRGHEPRPLLFDTDALYMLGTELGKDEPHHRTLRVFCAENITETEAEALRADLKKAKADPSYSILTNYSLNWVDVPPRAIISAPNASAEQLARLRAVLGQATEDPEYVAVLPFQIEIAMLEEG